MVGTLPKTHKFPKLFGLDLTLIRRVFSYGQLRLTSTLYSATVTMIEYPSGSSSRAENQN